PRKATLPLYSTVTGDRVVGTEMDADYWWKNVRQSVLFADAVEHLIDAGCDTVVELSPHPVLTTAVNECFDRKGKKVHAVGSLKRFESERQMMLTSLASLYVAGHPVDWRNVVPPLKKHVRFPNYAWQRMDCWYESDDSRRTRLATPDHPLLGCRRDDSGFAWQSRVDPRVFEYLQDHCVQMSPVMPASAYVELSLAAARTIMSDAHSWQVENLKLHNPLILAGNEARWMTTRFAPAGKKIEIASRAIALSPKFPASAPSNDEWTVHSSSGIRVNEDSYQPPPLDRDEMLKRCPVRYSQDDCYEYFSEIGLEYAGSFRGIQEAWRGDIEAFTRVELPRAENTEDYLLHPALLDSCFQSAIPAIPVFNHTIDDLYLPIEVERVRIYQPVDRQVWCHAYFTELSHNWRTTEFRIYNQDGTLAAEINALRSQRVSGATSESAANELLYDYDWQQQAAEPAKNDREPEQLVRPWIVFSDNTGVADALCSELRSRGGKTIAVTIGNDFAKLDENRYVVSTNNRDHIERLLKESLIDFEVPCEGIVHLWNLDAPHDDGCSTEQIELAQIPGVISQLHIVQAWDAVMDTDRAKLFVVTQGAQTVGDAPEPIRVAQGPAIGFGRVVIGEYPKLQCKLIDLDPKGSGDVSLLVNELFCSDEEDEIAYRGEQRFVHRYVPTAHTQNPIALNGQEVTYRLNTVRPGTVDGLEYEVVERPAPASDEVEIKVFATALNFSDVMKALGLYPGLEPGATPLGAECSGIVTRVGSDVSDFKIGDEVLAFAAPSFGSHVLTNEHLVAKKPARLSFEEAATIPVAFLTAEYALSELGRMLDGERVLIHSASGGVGLAAVQLAKNAGAEVFATAGTDEKRDFLCDLGVQHVMHSRSLGFVDDVMRATGGEGVDLILNSLPGDAIEKGLEILSEYGRFLEIGKRDIYKDTQVGLYPFRNNLSFFAIDLDRVMRQRPQILGRLLKKIVIELEEGTLQPIKHTVYDCNEIGDAFRFMQKGQHVGKIVISMASRPDRILPGKLQPTTFKANASYLITGGFGGFGLALAKWLVDRGVKNLVLLGRRGAHTLDAKAAVSELESAGANVTVVKADVTDYDGLAAALQQIRVSLPPLRGVFHAAMILEDALLTNLDDDLMWRVLKPKVNGTWNLHQLTQQDHLDHFMLFSSLSSVFGHAGQGNYAAANAFLDGMAHYRRANNQPCLTVNWGHVGEVGYLAERNELSERLERQGVMSFTIDEAMQCLDEAIHTRAIQVSVMRVEWERWTGLGVNGKISPRFVHLMPDKSGDESGFGLSAREQIQSASIDERPTIVAGLLQDKIVSVLGVDPVQMDLTTPLLDFGLDSLMAVELRNWMETEFKISVPIVELMRSPSLARLSELVCEGIGMSVDSLDESVNRTYRIDDEVEDLLSNVDNMTDREVDDLLGELLETEKDFTST
ncbi:MAG: SDR family NAD(P)-dependent oxidoreductase, partial [Planctomycetales bacterium]|nr:SDR family NAD(P)-dependent oxidoreductase [Planctomycetales bacterium]